MSSLSRSLISGVLIGLVGVTLSLAFFDRDREADLLFRLRGIVQPPADTVIISMDRRSADELDLPYDVSKWPRSLHARLTDVLSDEGAGVIGFDIFFNEPRDPEEDHMFAAAVRKARNVVVCEYVRTEKSRLLDVKGDAVGYTDIVLRVPPVPLISQAALASAPFPLPKVPVKVSRYWTFMSPEGHTPTLPVVAFQIFARDHYGDFIRLLKKHISSNVTALPQDKSALIDAGRMDNVLRTLRDVFQSEPELAERLLNDLTHDSETGPRERQVLKALISMYSGPDTHYLNFYGPARTITTVPYYQALGLAGRSSAEKRPDFRGKAVFVGRSEIVPSEKADGHYTVFSEKNGLDLSGVEIAATAFANILENSRLRPLPLYAYLGFIFIWGVAACLFCCRFRVAVSAAGLTSAGVLYFFAVRHLFASSGIWYPIVVPVFFQLPLAVAVSIIWKYVESRKFLHKEIAHKIDVGEDIAKLTADTRKFFGTCLITDIYESTKVSESLTPEAYSSLRKKYFDTLINPLNQNGVMISKTTGDGMLSAWDNRNGADSSTSACLAAIDIIKSVNRFNLTSGVRLNTRIGLHCGDISLEVISAADHYEYDLGGNTVNTVKRIEESNKILGTNILISDEVMHHLDGFLTRKVATFILKGKSIAFVLHELICRIRDSSAQQRDLCREFSEALDIFNGRAWEEAYFKFNSIIQRYGNDGPSIFYRDKCKYYKENPPSGAWEGEIYLYRK